MKILSFKGRLQIYTSKTFERKMTGSPTVKGVHLGGYRDLT